MPAPSARCALLVLALRLTVMRFMLLNVLMSFIIDVLSPSSRPDGPSQRPLRSGQIYIGFYIRLRLERRQKELNKPCPKTIALKNTRGLHGLEQKCPRIVT
ncbi:hypothetical protein Q1695_014831 [Nippostrongylus brasiliensis]|nr:hypothetical protein Q1695_014831 [Nippostrongylus brasiliensis]